jgi:hypothetical protein
MNIIMLLWWSLGRGNPVVPSRWQATCRNPQRPQTAATVAGARAKHRLKQTPLRAGQISGIRHARADRQGLDE